MTVTTTGPEFDVVIPAFNEENHISRCLEHVLAQDYPPELVRIWVVDAGSTDATAYAVAAWTSREPRISLITGRGRLNAGQALNEGIGAGTAELIARVDAHTYIEADYLRRAAEIMVEAGSPLACVGGQPTQVGESRFGRAVVLARRSHFGVGGSVYAERRPRVLVDTVQGGVYRRDALASVGGFATTMLVSEDEECNWRLRRAGYDILLDTSLRFTYTTRSTWRALFRQHRNYGRSRVRVVQAHPDFLRLRHVVPAAFVAGSASLAVMSLFSRRARRVFVATMGTYLAGSAWAGLKAAREEEPELAPWVAACFTGQHLGYGLGSIGEAASAVASSVGLAEPATAVTRR